MAVGRKRKPGKREKSGRPARTPRPDPRIHALSWPSRSHLPEAARLDQKAATPLGGLNILGVITDEQCEAGRCYADIVHRYRAVIEAPNPAPGGVDHGGRGYIPPDEAERRKAAYDSAYEALWDAGQQAARIVARVAVYEESCPSGRIEQLKLGLSALANYFGLTARVKSGNVRNVK